MALLQAQVEYCDWAKMLFFVQSEEGHTQNRLLTHCKRKEPAKHHRNTGRGTKTTTPHSNSVPSFLPRYNNQENTWASGGHTRMSEWAMSTLSRSWFRPLCRTIFQSTWYTWCSTLTSSVSPSAPQCTSSQARSSYANTEVSAADPKSAFELRAFSQTGVSC